MAMHNFSYAGCNRTITELGRNRQRQAGTLAKCRSDQSAQASHSARTSCAAIENR